MNLQVINNWIMHLLNDSKKAECKMYQADNQYRDYGEQFGTAQSLQLHI
jgi:hypothetical protein